MILAAQYARYSTNLQKQTSIVAQLQEIARYCEKNGLTPYPRPYIDEGESGTNIHRPGFEALLRDAHAGLFGAVVVYDISRGSRNIADWFSFRREMAELGIRVYSATEQLGDLDNADDFLRESLSVSIGHHQVLQTRQKSIAGKRVRAESGLFCGGNAPLGYQIVDGRYVIVEREAAVVRMIFEMYATGASYADIMRSVDKTGILMHKGNPITKNTLHYILKNERYTGKYIWFETESRHMHRWVGRPGTAPIEKPDVIPAIISQSVWNAVCRRMTENKHNTLNHNRPDRQYMLSGLIVCAHCGARYTGLTTTSKGREYKRYVCSFHANGHKCPGRPVNGYKLESYVKNLVIQRILSPELMNGVADKLIAAIRSSSSARPESLREEIDLLDRKNKNLLAAIENGLPPEISISRIRENDARKKELLNELNALPPATYINRDDILDILRADSQRCLELDASKLIAKYVQKIVMADDAFDVYILPEQLRSDKKSLQTLNKFVGTVGSSGISCTVPTISAQNLIITVPRIAIL